MLARPRKNSIWTCPKRETRLESSIDKVSKCSRGPTMKETKTLILNKQLTKITDKMET